MARRQERPRLGVRKHAQAAHWTAGRRGARSGASSVASEGPEQQTPTRRRLHAPPAPEAGCRTIEHLVRDHGCSRVASCPARTHSSPTHPRHPSPNTLFREGPTQSGIYVPKGGQRPRPREASHRLKRGTAAAMYPCIKRDARVSSRILASSGLPHPSAAAWDQHRRHRR